MQPFGFFSGDLLGAGPWPERNANPLSQAVEHLCANGMNVLLEGRVETLNFFRSPYRFELVVENPDILGYRRGAQRVFPASTQPFPDVPPESIFNAQGGGGGGGGTSWEGGPGPPSRGPNSRRFCRFVGFLGMSHQNIIKRQWFQEVLSM